MIRKEFALFAMALKTYYPKDDLLPNEQAVDLWFKQLKDLDYQLAETALNKWVALNKWPPTIADIRAEVTSFCFGELPEWGEAWQKVNKAISIYGMYRPKEALESMDEITRQCVERLGFINLCTSDNVSADRANFRKLYEQYAQRQKSENQIPKVTQERISQFSALMIGYKGGGGG